MVQAASLPPSTSSPLSAFPGCFLPPFPPFPPQPPRGRGCRAAMMPQEEERCSLPSELTPLQQWWDGGMENQQLEGHPLSAATFKSFQVLHCFGGFFSPPTSLERRCTAHPPSIRSSSFLKTKRPCKKTVQHRRDPQHGPTGLSLATAKHLLGKTAGGTRNPHTITR